VLVMAALAAVATLWLRLGFETPGVRFGAGRTGADYRTFATAGQLVADGTSGLVYADAPYAAANAPLFVYPMWYALWMSPMSAVATGIGYVVWNLGTLAAMLGGYILVGRRAGLAVGAAMAISVCGYQQILFGQSAFLLAAVGGLAIWALSEQRFAIGGLAIAFMGFKPHIAAVLLLICVVVPKCRPALGWAIGGSLTLLALGELVAPGSTMTWLNSVVSNHRQLVDPSSEFTVRAAVEALGGFSFPLWVKLLPLGAAYVWLWSLARRKVVDIGTLAVCGLGLGIVLGPHSLVYDLLVVGPAVALAFQTRPADRKVVGVAGIVALSVVTIAPFVRVAMSDFALVPVPVLAAVITLVLVYFGETAPNRTPGQVGTSRSEEVLGRSLL
jgi:Glycosyltransferase family 87